MSCISYQKIETRCSSSHSPCDMECYDDIRMSKEKDKLISQLKTHIFELELREKDYNMLNERCIQLQNDIAVLNECKLKLECEKKIKDGNFNKNICCLQGENENLQLNYNEKLSSNKNLFSENNTLAKQIELKDAEICQLNLKLNDLTNQLKINDEDRKNLQNIVQGLNDVKCSQNVKISQLLEDNKTLTGICKEQDCNLKCSDHDKVLLGKELDKNNNDIQNLNCQIRQRVCEENDLQTQINKCNTMNTQFQNNIKDYEVQNNGLKCENDNLKNKLVQEKSVRIEENQKNNQLNNILNDREQKINMLNHDIESIKLMQLNASNRNCVLQEENAKLRDHILVLTDLNQTLNNEIDDVINEDAKMRCILDRKERINSVLVSNRCAIDNSLNSLDEYINRTNNFNCLIPCCHECP